MSEQMKLCMCGLPAQSYTTESANGIIRYAIGCNDPLCHWTAGEYDTEAAAIAAWNQRAGDAELAALRKLCGEVKVAEESLVSAMLFGPVESGMVSDHQRRLSAALNTYDETIKGAENE